MSDVTKPVVVGVDKSPASRGALWWAVREARMRRSALLIMHALSVSEPHPERARAVTEDALGYARSLGSDLTVDAIVDDRAAGRALCRLSNDAALIVVASRGLGGLRGLLLGSVSAYVAAHADCPVLVIHDGQNSSGPDLVESSTKPVLLGVGPYGVPAEIHEPTLAFAFAEAQMRGVHVYALRAWTPPPAPWRSDVRPLAADVAEIETSERLDLTEILLPWRQKYPGVSVRQRVTPVSAAAALVDAASAAQLVVVGARIHRAPGLRLGSVSQQVLHHAPSSVAVVHSPTRP